MRILQILLLGSLSCVFSIKCQPFVPSKSNNYHPVEIEVGEKSNARIGGGNGVNTYAAFSVRRKRFSRSLCGSGLCVGSPPTGCKPDLFDCEKHEECCSKQCNCARTVNDLGDNVLIKRHCINTSLLINTTVSKCN